MPNFTTLGVHRDNCTAKGGNILAINSQWKVVKHLLNDYYIAALISKGKTNFIVASIYIPPVSSKYAPASYAHVVEEMCF
jgi:hypothetical protein